MYKHQVGPTCDWVGAMYLGQITPLDYSRADLRAVQRGRLAVAVRSDVTGSGRCGSPLAMHNSTDSYCMGVKLLENIAHGHSYRL